MPSSIPAQDEIEAPQQTPKLGFFVYYLAFMAVIGGFLFGYDTGIVSSAMLYVPGNPDMQPMSYLWQELIVSLTPGAAAIGSLFAGPASDKLGRRLIIIAASFAFTLGAIVCCAATSKAVLLVGRILLGFAIGFASMVVPVYVSEASPYYLRGALTTGFQLMITFGLFSSNILAGAFSYWNPEYVGWRLMLGFAMVPSVIQFIGFFFLPESPRYLFSVGKHKETREVLKRIYAGCEEWVDFVLMQINVACEQEQQSKAEVREQFVLIRILRTPHVLKALCIGCLIQFFQQLSGINTIMYYTATIVKSAGIEDSHESIWIASAIAAVNFLATFVPLATVEKFGRRPLMLISIAGVVASLTMMGVSFLLIHNDSATTRRYSLSEMYNGSSSVESEYRRCEPLVNCDACVTNEHCGFCRPAANKRAEGYCLAKTQDNPEVSVFGYCEEGHNSSFVFDSTFCQSKFTIMPIVFMIIYLIFFAIGYAPLCWLLNSEFYPLWARSTGCALSTFSNWAGNLLVSLTFLTLSEAATRYGAFFIYDGLTMIALVFVFFFVPETKGMTIEEVEKLFMSKKERRRFATSFSGIKNVLQKTGNVDGMTNSASDGRNYDLENKSTEM